MRPPLFVIAIIIIHFKIDCGISDTGALALLKGVGDSQAIETLVISGNPKLSNAVAQRVLQLLDLQPSFRFVEAAGTGPLSHTFVLNQLFRICRLFG